MSGNLFNLLSLFFVHVVCSFFLELNLGHLIIKDDAMVEKLPGKLRGEGEVLERVHSWSCVNQRIK